MARLIVLIIKTNLLIGDGYGLISHEQLKLNMLSVTDILIINMISLIIIHYVHILKTKIVGYKIQDKLCKREICKDYSTSDCF